MRIGIIGDAHLTKSMGNLTSKFRAKQLQAFEFMYQKFHEQCVKEVYILGDLLDKPSIDADSLDHVAGVLHYVDIPTHLLLGNHEAVRGNINILHCLKYHNKLIIDDCERVYEHEGSYFHMVPYYMDLTDIIDIEDHILFTHHDLYPKGIPGGIDIRTTQLTSAHRVFNGHVHDIGYVTDNIFNVGSCFELGHVPYVEHHPKFYIYDTVTDQLDSYDQPHTLRFMTVNGDEIKDLPDLEDTVIRLRFEGEKPVIPKDKKYLRVTMQKVIKDDEVLERTTVNHAERDPKDILSEYVMSQFADHTEE